ncbi:MAG: anthranilate phosphoribosyltransferase [Kineosporiaceae bacterium]
MSDPAAPQPTWPDLTAGVLSGRDLSRAETSWAMDRVMTGESTPVQLAGFLIALRGKGETVAEITGLVETMLQHAVRIEVPGPCVDVVGTGGDRHRTVNISTSAALVVAGSGRRVVKHGNRASTSASGAADVLEALGVRLDLAPERVAELATEVGITFCFAPVFHPAFRHAGQARRELGVPTAFNVLGPLTNPAQPAAAAVGVADLRLAPIVAGVLAERGASALVFRGENGLDELSTTGPSQVWLVEDGTVVEHRIDPAELGLAPARLEDLRGGDGRNNAAVLRDVLEGGRGPVRDTVLLNAAAGIVAADGAVAGGGRALADRLTDALKEAGQAVDSGAAAAVLDRWVKASNS